MCSMAWIRRFVATRKAPMWEHISPAIYTSTASTELPTASQPYSTRCWAWAKCGATASTSSRIFQMYQKGTRASRALPAESTQEA